ncbi:hypothetical protein V1477_001508 [Vespula maculifrons]|uniref:Uncharacterized protein n=1 Tax=Vespula maculifrons TaxID=7453 RepID=A0ABD2D056_VESMC
MDSTKAVFAESSIKVFPFISEFNSNLPRHMKHKFAREAPNSAVYANNVAPLFAHYYTHWTARSEESFKKQSENLTKKRRLSYSS